MSTDPLVVFGNFAIIPADEATSISLTPTLRFNCDMAGGTVRTTYQEYHYQLRFVVNAETVYTSPTPPALWGSSSGGFEQAYPQSNPTTAGHSASISYTLTEGQGDLAYGLTYTWSVDLKYQTDSAWTEVISGEFTVMEEPVPDNPPEAPINPSPANEVDDVRLTVGTVSWEDGGSGETAATLYSAWMWRDGEDPEEDVVELVNLQPGTSADIPYALENGRTYYWFVAAYNDNGEAYGDTWSFVATAPTPDKPVNPNPATGASGIDFSQAILSWSDGGSGETSATSFEVRIGMTNDESMIVVASGPETSTPIGVILLPGLWYWRVDATNDNGTTTGDTWTFTVDEDPVQEIENSTAWHPYGTYAARVYHPDANISLILSSNDSLDGSGVIVGAVVGYSHKLDNLWAIYTFTLPPDCQVGSLYIKWNYNDE